MRPSYEIVAERGEKRENADASHNHLRSVSRSTSFQKCQVHNLWRNAMKKRVFAWSILVSLAVVGLLFTTARIAFGVSCNPTCTIHTDECCPGPLSCDSSMLCTSGPAGYCAPCGWGDHCEYAVGGCFTVSKCEGNDGYGCTDLDPSTRMAQSFHCLSCTGSGLPYMGCNPPVYCGDPPSTTDHLYDHDSRLVWGCDQCAGS